VGKWAGGILEPLDMKAQWNKDEGREDLNVVERVLRAGFRYGASSAGSGAGAFLGAGCTVAAPACIGAGIVAGGEIGERVADGVIGFLDRTDADLPNLPNLPDLPDTPDLPDGPTCPI
jgi:hypothetical protein